MSAEQDIYALRAELRFTANCIHIAIAQVSQVTRNLTLALLATMKEDQNTAVKELGEIHERLAEADRYLGQLDKILAGQSDAG